MNNVLCNNFDVLWLIGVFLVLVSYQFVLFGWWELRFVGDYLFGNLGVFIFFVISGYLVIFSWLSDLNMLCFVVCCILWMVLVLCVFMLLIWVVIVVFGLIGFFDNFRYFINGLFWFIKYEVVCYVFLLVVGVVIWCVFFVLVVGLFGYFVFLGWQFGEMILVYFGFYFVVGSLFWVYLYLCKFLLMVLCLVMGYVFICMYQIKFGFVFVVLLLMVVVGLCFWFGL